MKLPSKITSYKESVLSKIPFVLAVLQNTDIGVFALYAATSKYFSGIEEFMDTLDCLFALNKVTYDAEREVLHYVV